MIKRTGLLALLGLTCMAAADTVYLTNGNSLVGKIVDVNADPIVLEVKGGKLTFELTEIQELDINDQGFQGTALEADDAAAAVGDAEIAGKAASIADLPPPKDEAERSRRYDLVMTQLSKVTMNREEATQEELDRADEYVKALGQLGPSVAPAIEDTFRNGSVRSAGAMLGALRVADPARAEALAREAITHVHPEAREEAIAIIAASQDKDKGELLTKALADPRPLNRIAALNALGETKDAATATSVVKLTTDANPDVQAQAIAAMQAITGEKLATPEEWAAWAQQKLGTQPGEAEPEAGATPGAK